MISFEYIANIEHIEIGSKFSHGSVVCVRCVPSFLASPIVCGVGLCFFGKERSMHGRFVCHSTQRETETFGSKYQQINTHNGGEAIRACTVKSGAQIRVETMIEEPISGQ